MNDPLKNAFIQEACRDLFGGKTPPQEIPVAPVQQQMITESDKDDLRNDFASSMFDPKALKEGLKTLYKKQSVKEQVNIDEKRDFKAEANDEASVVLSNILKGMK